MTPDQKYAYARSFPVHVGVDTGKKFCGFRIFWPRRFRKLWHQGRGFVAGEFLLFLKVPGSIAGTA